MDNMTDGTGAENRDKETKYTTGSNHRLPLGGPALLLAGGTL